MPAVQIIAAIFENDQDNIDLYTDKLRERNVILKPLGFNEDQIRKGIAEHDNFIIDLHLGDELPFSGLTLIQKVKNEKPFSKIAVLTGHPDEEGRAISRGADLFLVKGGRRHVEDNLNRISNLFQTSHNIKEVKAFVAEVGIDMVVLECLTDAETKRSTRKIYNKYLFHNIPDLSVDKPILLTSVIRPGESKLIVTDGTGKVSLSDFLDKDELNEDLSDLKGSSIFNFNY